MEPLRFGYRAKMRTSVLAPPADIVWVQVPTDTPIYRKRTVFRSRNWTKEPFNDGMGEQSSGRVCCGKRDIEWYNGANANRFSGGLVPCGTDEVAAVGGGPDDPLHPTAIDGSALCCIGGPAFVSHIHRANGAEGTFHGRGNTPLVGQVCNLVDFGPPTPLARTAAGNPAVVIFNYPREGATQLTVTFNMAVMPPVVNVSANTSITFTDIEAWGNRYLRFRIKYTGTGNLHKYVMEW